MKGPEYDDYSFAWYVVDSCRLFKSPEFLDERLRKLDVLTLFGFPVGVSEGYQRNTRKIKKRKIQLWLS